MVPILFRRQNFVTAMPVMMMAQKVQSRVASIGKISVPNFINMC